MGLGSVLKQDNSELYITFVPSFIKVKMQNDN